MITFTSAKHRIGHSAAPASIRTLGNPSSGQRGVHDAEYTDRRSQGHVQSPTGRGRELVDKDDDGQDYGPANAGYADQDHGDHQTDGAAEAAQPVSPAGYGAGADEVERQRSV